MKITYGTSFALKLTLSIVYSLAITLWLATFLSLPFNNTEVSHLDNFNSAPFWTEYDNCNKNLLLYNRYPKSGSTTFSHLLKLLAADKGYVSAALGNVPRHMDNQTVKVK